MNFTDIANQMTQLHFFALRDLPSQHAPPEVLFVAAEGRTLKQVTISDPTNSKVAFETHSL
jgi:hypothetical protein